MGWSARPLHRLSIIGLPEPMISNSRARSVMPGINDAAQTTAKQQMKSL
jgi:hypothetical protein